MRKILLSFLFLTTACFAQEEVLTKSEEVSEILAQNTPEPNYFGMLLGLFVVIGLIYLSGYLYQKLTKVKFNIEDIYLNKAQVISTTPLGQGKSLHVIKFGNEAFLIGASQDNITFIKDVKLQESSESKEEQNGKDS